MPRPRVPVLAPGVMQSFVENLHMAANWVRRSLTEPGSDDEKAQRYAEFVDRELQRHLSDTKILPAPRWGTGRSLVAGAREVLRKRGLSI